MSIKDNGEFRHFDRMMRKAEKDNGKNSSRPASCQQCIFYQPKGSIVEESDTLETRGRGGDRRNPVKMDFPVDISMVT